MVNKVLTYTLMSFPASKAKEVLPLQAHPFFGHNFCD